MNTKASEMVNLAINGAASAIVSLTQAADPERSAAGSEADIHCAVAALKNAVEAAHDANNAA